MVGWRYFGVNIPYPFIVIACIIFVVDMATLKIISGAFTTLGEAFQVARPFGRMKEQIARPLTSMRKDLKKGVKEIEEKSLTKSQKKLQRILDTGIKKKEAEKRDRLLYEQEKIYEKMKKTDPEFFEKKRRDLWRKKLIKEEEETRLGGGVLGGKRIYQSSEDHLDYNKILREEERRKRRLKEALRIEEQ